MPPSHFCLKVVCVCVVWEGGGYFQEITVINKTLLFYGTKSVPVYTSSLTIADNSLKTIT